jgi:hypothetical protein
MKIKLKCVIVWNNLQTIRMSKINVKDNWDDSSDEEVEVVQAPTVQVPTVHTVNMQDNCENCYVCNHDIENDTSYYPQCENKALLDRMKEMDECSSDEVGDEGEEYYSDEEDGEGDYPSYDDECELMDKKMGMHIRF